MQCSNHNDKMVDSNNKKPYTSAPKENHHLIYSEIFEKLFFRIIYSVENTN